MDPFIHNLSYVIIYKSTLFYYYSKVKILHVRAFFTFRLSLLLTFNYYKKNDSVRKKNKRLFVLEYRKRHFPGLNCLKKKFKKGPLLDQNHGLTPLKKCQFFDCLNLLFYSQERRFFVVEYRKRHFPGQYCLKRKSWKSGHFWAKTKG